MNLFATAAVVAVNLVVFGAHARFPFRLADAPPPARRAWALAAPPALLLAFTLTALALWRQPDAAIAWGLTGPLADSRAARLIAVAMAALAVADLVVAAGWRRLEPLGWRILGVLGGVGALSHALGAELLRIGWGPVPGFGLLLLAAALRLPLALAAAELVEGPPGNAVVVAAPALVAAFAVWPESLRHALRADVPTLAAAALLLAAARWTPPRFRRAAACAGLALAVLFLARAADHSAALGLRDVVPAGPTPP